jgi:short-subunit dehydrogenase
MLPSGVALRHVVAAVAAACTGSFLLMDCNPSLFCYDRYLQVTSPSPQQGGQGSIAAAAAASVSGAVSCGGYHSFHDTKCVWIVGASSGIGREMAEQLAVSGVQHLVLSSRSAAKCNAVADKCRKLNPACRLTVLPVNVTDTASLERAVQTIANDITSVSWPLDMVVMNAGVGQLLPALETDAATTEHIVRSNALWPMILTPLLFAKTPATTSPSSQQSPHLVITSSIAGKLAVPLSAAYAASKFAIQGYFSSLASERPDLRIDLLCPGPVDTEFHRNNNNNDSNDNKNDDDDKTDEPTAPSKMKMPVDRCVALMLSAMQRNRQHQHQQQSQSLLPLLLQPLQFQEVWIALQPSLIALYIQQWFPGLQRRILGIVGPKRVQLWREGYDLYDPASWRRQTKTTASNINDDSVDGNVNGNNAKAVVDNMNNHKDKKY